MENTKTNNKIIIFDWGGVIESHRDSENNIFYAIINVMRRLNCKMSDEEILEKYDKISEFKGISIGAINNLDIIKKWYQNVSIEFKIDASFDEFTKVYEEEFEKVYFYKEVVELIYELKNKCKIGILSNLNWLDKKRLDKQVDLSKFDYQWLSFEIGHVKPQLEIYEFVEKSCQISVSNILFIDDNTDNILAAKERGWNVCQSCGYEINKINNAIKEFLK